jgi:hypothetical protein
MSAMIEYANLFLSAVSALSSLIQATKSINHDSHEASFKTEINKARKRSITPMKVGGKQISLVIDATVLATLTGNINSSLEHLVIALGDNSLNWADKNVAITRASSEICKSLSAIKRLNNGNFPSKRLDNLWQSHC